MDDPEAAGRLLTALWRLENGLTLTSGTGPEAELTVGSIDPRSSLELDICRQNLRSLKSPLALAAATTKRSNKKTIKKNTTNREKNNYRPLRRKAWSLLTG